MTGQQTLLNYFASALGSQGQGESLRNQKRLACKELEANNPKDCDVSVKNKKVKMSSVEADCKPQQEAQQEKSKNQKRSGDDEDRKEKLIIMPDNRHHANSSKMTLGFKTEIQSSTLSTKMLTMERETCGVVNDLGQSWYSALQAEFRKTYFVKLSKFLEEERSKYTIYPPWNEVFSWTRECDISQIKVVILGQDPYHNIGQAHGFAFSVQKGVALPPSLGNIFKELQTDVTDFVKPQHGDLTGWAKQGVLLLNAVLTVRAHQANSHKDKGWEQLTDAVIQYVNANLNNVVFILWGAYAQKKGAIITKSKHLVLNGPHPSPLSAHRGFFGCRHFSRANTYLIEHGHPPIDWSHL